MSREALTAFVQQLTSDPDLSAMIENRKRDKQVSMADALDYAVDVGAKKGFVFTREELSEALQEKAAAGNTQGAVSDKQLENVAGGLSFSNIRVGLNNPTRLMCQYGAALGFLSSK